MKKHIHKRAYHADIVDGINGCAVKNYMGKGNKADNKKAPLLFTAIYKVIREERKEKDCRDELAS